MGAMIKIRPADTIYRSQGGWYDARWHFSFDQYYDPEFMGFGALRVFNDDRLIPGAVWPMHPHRDIEGITYVVEGVFEHADNLGNGGILHPGAVQRATLGRGMQHSERNGSAETPMRFLQFWILPDTADLEPSVEQRQYTRDERTNRLLDVLNPEGEGGALKVHQNARVLVSYLEPEAGVTHGVEARRGVYVYLIDGLATLNGDQLRTGDAAIVQDESSIEIAAVASSELILVEVPLEYEPVGVWRRAG
jgi:redox-sensitive bicupin YhaK (pirin superfamily)